MPFFAHVAPLARLIALIAMTLCSFAPALAPAAYGQDAASVSAEAQVQNGITLAQLMEQIEAERTALAARDASEVEWLLFDGKVLKLTGNFEQSAEVYRRVLTLEPENLVARQELAHALFLARDFRASKFHFETLERSDPVPERRQLYRRFLSLIAQNQPFGIQGFFSIVPSSNVNRGTTNTVFDTTLGQFVIDPSSQVSSGLGVNAGVSGYFRRVLSERRRVALNWGLSGTRYEDDQYDSTTATLGVALETIEPWGSWFASPFARRTWREDDSDNDAFGLTVGGRYGIDARHAISGSISHEFREYPNQSFQDGPFTSLTVYLERQINPALSVNIGFGLERSVPEADHLRYDGARLILGGARAWTGGLQTNASIEYGDSRL